MLRDKTLIPLSHQHQHALALCVRIERASPIAQSDLAAWQAEIVQLCRGEIEIHFAAEEEVIFRLREVQEMNLLVSELAADHAALRAMFARAEAGEMAATDVLEWSRRLAAHIRKEERELFERMQELMPREQLDAIGARLVDALKPSGESCLLPSETTKLKASRSPGR